MDNDRSLATAPAPFNNNPLNELQAGVTINPLRFSEATAKTLGHKGRSAEAERESKKVVTVAGGMARVGKGQVAK